MSKYVETATFGKEKESFVGSSFVEESFHDKEGNKVTVYVDKRNKKIYMPKQFSHNVQPYKEFLFCFTEIDSAEKLSALICLQLRNMRKETLDKICRDISYRHGIW